MLIVVSQQRLTQSKKLLHSPVRDPVVDNPVLAARLDEATPTQTGKVVRDLRLRNPKAGHQFTNRQLRSVTQELQDAKPGRVAQRAKVLRDQIGLHRCGGQTERSKLAHQRLFISEAEHMMLGMPTTIDWHETQRLLAAGAQLVEVLPAAEYAEAHLPGALNIPLKELDRARVALLDPVRPVIVYCWDYL